MAISLVKGQKISLAKESGGASLTKIAMGLGWDAAKKKTGILGAIFGGGKPDSIDLDASCILFDVNKSMTDAVWFRQLRSKDGSIQHSGDNLKLGKMGKLVLPNFNVSWYYTGSFSKVKELSWNAGNTLLKTDAAFKELFGVKKSIFLKMHAILTDAYHQRHRQGGRRAKLSLGDQLLAAPFYGAPHFILSLRKCYKDKTPLRFAFRRSSKGNNRVLPNVPKAYMQAPTRQVIRPRPY
jgi:hypothetical protein